MVIASIVAGAVCLWVIKKFEPEGAALKLLWVIFLSCVGNIIFVLLFGDFTKTTVSPEEIHRITAQDNIPKELR